MGRLVHYLPKRGALPPRRPVTRGEAQAALRRCGLSLASVPQQARTPFPLVSADTQLRVNPHSDNGFPVLGKWDDPGAAELCQKLATTLRTRFVAAGEDVAGCVRELMETQPELVALRGKAKADYYTLDKVAGGMMRYYNAFPRHIALNIQMATQPFERLSRHIAPNTEYHSGIGLTLVRGGAQSLVDALQWQLDERGFAYVHVGDDSWVVVLINDVLIMFALDCSSFDLTQHGDVTQAVHDVLRDELSLIDGTSAQLWHCFMRERLVVLALSVAVRLRHAGPSGAPLQSKVNDMLMDIMITRALAELKGATESEVGDVLKRVGDEMGFVVRIEQYQAAWGETEIRHMLQRQPFLFIGYNFWADDAGRVFCYCDVPRTFSQIVTPSVGWKRAKGEFELAEAMRLGSIAMNFGMPPPQLMLAFETFKSRAKDLVSRQLAVRGDSVDERLRWAVQENPFAAAAEPNLSGLLRVLNRPAAALWASPELPATVTWVPLTESWAEQMDREDQDVLVELGISPTALERPVPLTVRPIPLPTPRATTHPATSANAGRPPPTAIWGPPRPRREQAVLRGTRRRLRRDGVVEYEDTDSLYTITTERTERSDDERWSSDDFSDVWGWS